MKNNIQCLQANLQRSIAASATLVKDLNDFKKPVIGLIQEPYLLHGEVRVLGNFRNSRLFYKKGTVGPRACIVVGPGISATALPDFFSRDLVAVQVSYKTGNSIKEVIICSAYFASEKTVPTPDFRRLVNYCQANRLPLVMGCDANAHNAALWGSTDTNKRGEDLELFLTSTHLDVLNRGRIGTFHDHRREEVIDITICTNSFSPNIFDWRVDLEESMSDHRHILFEIRANAPLPTYYRSTKQTDWVLYKKRLGELFVESEVDSLPCRTEAEIERKVGAMHEVMSKAFHEACPLKRVRSKRSVPWWSDELTQLRKEARRLHKIFSKSKLELDFENYKTGKARYNRALKKAKRDEWRSSLNGMDDHPSLARVYRNLKEDHRIQLGMLQTSPGEYTGTKEEALEHMLSTHFPECELDEANFQESSFSQASADDFSTAVKVVTRDRVAWAIRNFKPFKSAGEDGILPKLLQEGLDIIQDSLVDIYRACLAHGFTPKTWRAVRVVFLPKPGKDNYADAKSYRPISLMSFLLKGLERLVDRFLRDGILLDSPLHASQHAYREGRSTISALHSLVTKIQDSLDHKEWALGVFFDIAGAFDNVDFNVVGSALTERQASPAIIRWINCMLSCRSVRASIDEAKQLAQPRRGCPQGGVLSPLLWTLVADSLLSELNRLGYPTTGYSDDGVTLISGASLGDVCTRTQAALRFLEAWCRPRGLSVNPRKTELVLFTRKLSRKAEGYFSPVLFGEALRLRRQTKYLGVILDEKLSWRPHIKTIKTKASKALWICRRLIGLRWGANPKASYWMYTSIVRPMIIDAAPIWWKGASEILGIQQTLSVLQRIALVGITGVMSTTPTAALENMLNLASLHVQAEAEAMLSARRLLDNQTWGDFHNLSGHREVRDRLFFRVVAASYQSDTMSRFVFDKSFQTSIPTRLEWQGNRAELLPDQVISCFTDGSRRHGRSGMGIFVPFCNQICDVAQTTQLGTLPSVFQTEVRAIQAGADLVLSLDATASPVVIYSDSQAAVKALSAPKIRSSLVLDCVQALNSLAAVTSVTVCWIPGHSSFAGNNKADALANQATATPYLGLEPVLPVTSGHIKREVKAWVQAAQTQLWVEREDCCQSKFFIKGPNIGLCRQLLALSRVNLKIVAELFTGHCPLARHLFIRHCAVSPICKYCEQDEETAWHFLAECPMWANLRFSVWGQFRLRPGRTAGLQPKALLRFTKSSGRLLAEQD
ncbi:MAG: reverse transcriptase-like protein [Gammaproteobacteria bacterium]|nr:reverse transcriptase-like protein [Gammaproteobacteria bacterium]